MKRRGFKLVGPTVRDGAIVYDELGAVADLLIGWTDEQDGGTYRLKKRGDEALFGYVVGLEREWGYFVLSDLETVRGPLGLAIERDLYFRARPISQVREGQE